MLALRRLGLRPRRTYSTYTSSLQCELFYTVLERRSDQNYKHRAFLAPSSKAPGVVVRIRTPAVPPIAAVFFV